MAKSSKRKSQSRKPANKKYEKYRGDVKELKRLGLYKGSLRKPITKYAASEAKRFSDVLSGKATAVKAPKTSARNYTQSFKTKYRTVIIPRKSGEKVFYDRKSGKIVSYREEYGLKIKRIIPAKPITADNISELPRGPNIKYVIPIGAPGHVERFDSYEQLAQFMQQYQVPHLVVGDKYGTRISQYKSWHKYVEIEIIEGDDTRDGSEDF